MEEGGVEEGVPPFTASETKWMSRALSIAEEALDAGEVPVGCVFVVDGKEVAAGANRTNIDMCATRHAELVAVEKAASTVDWRRAELYVTCEPCIMCASAMKQLGIAKVFFGCRNDKFGGCGSILSLHDGAYESREGLEKEKAVALFRRFYKRENVRTAESADAEAASSEQKPPENDDQPKAKRRKADNSDFFNNCRLC